MAQWCVDDGSGLMRIHWAMHQKVEAAGAAYGYTSASTNLLGAMLRRSRVQIVDDAADADVSVHFCHPAKFEPTSSARNVLFTMYEFDPLPSDFREGARLADAVVVPSEFCADLFAEHLDSGTTIRVSPLGFDPEFWTYRPRSLPHESEPFRFLFTGDLNDRKGYHLLMEAWGAVFADVPGVELYMKLSGEGPVENRKKVSRGNVTCDFRSLPRAELVELFHRSHAFVFPSMGEGWGLTALEAAATGLPVLTTRCGGVEAFLDERLTRWIPSHAHAVRISPRHGGGVAIGVRAEPRDIALQMRDVIAQYTHALKCARKQSRMVRERFTWDDAARSLVGVLDELVAARRAA